MHNVAEVMGVDKMVADAVVVAAAVDDDNWEVYTYLDLVVALDWINNFARDYSKTVAEIVDLPDHIESRTKWAHKDKKRAYKHR